MHGLESGCYSKACVQNLQHYNQLKYGAVVSIRTSGLFLQILLTYMCTTMVRSYYG